MAEIITTGGTFDKLLVDPNDQDNYYFPLKSYAHEILERRRVDLTPHLVRSIMWLDSLDMDQSHFDMVATACIESSEQKLVVIHGTDKMIECAQQVERRLKRAGRIQSKKRVVFTGAMEPYSVNPEHAAYNLYHALEATKGPSGVKIAMSSNVFNTYAVKKNYDTLKFESI